MIRIAPVIVVEIGNSVADTRRSVQRAGGGVRRERRRNGAGRDIDFLLGKIGEGRGGKAEIPRQHVRRRVPEPVADRVPNSEKIAVAKTSRKVQVPGPRPWME
jgi:hypothetical protein